MKEHAVSANAPFVDPISDEGFLQIFGNEANKVVVIDFLNTILEGLEVICDLQHLPVGSHSLNGEILLDLLCTDEKGEHFLVHLQRSEWLTPDGSLMYHRSEEHTSELQSLMRISYAVFCLKKKKRTIQTSTNN